MPFTLVLHRVHYKKTGHTLYRRYMAIRRVRPKGIARLGGAYFGEHLCERGKGEESTHDTLIITEQSRLQHLEDAPKTLSF